MVSHGRIVSPRREEVDDPAARVIGLAQQKHRRDRISVPAKQDEFAVGPSLEDPVHLAQGVALGGDTAKAPTACPLWGGLDDEVRLHGDNVAHQTPVRPELTIGPGAVREIL